MAFRWFRKNKKATRWLYIGVTVFVMVTFTVTGAMMSGLDDDSGTRLAGSFVLPSGQTVDVKEVDFERLGWNMGRAFGRKTEESQIWEFIMLRALANEAGVRVDGEVKNDVLRQLLTRIGVSSESDYKTFLQNISLSALDFEDLIIDQAKITIYRQVAAAPPSILSSEIFERFQKDHELFRVEYVSFADDSELASLEGVAVDEEELQRFYDEDLDPVLRENEFSYPEKYGLDAAILRFQGQDPGALGGYLPEGMKEVSAEEVRDFYDANIESFLIELDDDGEGDDLEAGDDESAEDSDRYQPFEDAKKNIELEILARRIVSEALSDYRNRRLDLSEEEEEEDAANGSEEGSGEAVAADDSSPDDGSDKKGNDIFPSVAAKYGLEIVDLGEPRTAEELEELPEVGRESLGRSMYLLEEGQVQPLYPDPEHPVAALLRVREKVESESKPLADVRDQLVVKWRESQAREKTRARADAFRTELKKRAEVSVQAEVDAIRQKARDAATAAIESEGITDEAEKAARVDLELGAVKSEIDALVLPHEGGIFGPLAEEQGLSLEAVNWFRSSYRTTGFWRDEDPSTRHFVMGHAPLFSIEIEGVLGPVRDVQGKEAVVIHVLDRRSPTHEEMRLKDRVEAEMKVAQDKDPNFYLRRFGYPVPDPEFTVEGLSQRLRLTVVTPDTKADDTEEGPSG